jgi:methyltransferase
MSGPLGFLKHPDYAIVAGEVLVLPAGIRTVVACLLFSVINGLMLWWRIRIEEQALAPQRVPPLIASL